MNLRKIAKRQMRLSAGGRVNVFAFRWGVPIKWPRGLNKPRGVR